MHRSLLEPDVFELFLKPGEVVEVRALGGPWGTIVKG
jgi:hypothetical protein